jgi:hypothetical protein
LLARRPQLVVWQAGGNEALRQGSADTFRARMGEGLARLRGAGIPVVLMDNQRSPRLLAEGRGAVFDRELAGLAGPASPCSRAPRPCAAGRQRASAR